MLFVISVFSALVCAAVAAALGRWMRSLAQSDSRWLRSGLHILLAAAGGLGAAHIALGMVDLATFGILAVSCSLLISIDLAVNRLPDAIVLPMYPVLFTGLAVTAASFDRWGPLGRAALGAAVLLGLYCILARIRPSGLGLGDVKLAGVLGAFLGWLGWPALLVGTLAAFAINAAVALVLLAARRVTFTSGIAFGPAMILGAASGAVYSVAQGALGPA